MLKNLFCKYLILCLIAAAMLMGSVTGCSPNGKIKLDSDNPETIVIWHYYHGAQKSAFDLAVKEFNETAGYENGVIVEAISYGDVGGLADNVIAAANGELDAGNMPDVFGSYGDTALEILNMGKAAAISQYLSEDVLDEYEESFILQGKIGTDELYVFPIAKSSESLMLNKTHFDAFAEELKATGSAESVGYDDLRTWEGILRVSDIYYRHTQALSPENKGKAFFGLDSLANYIIIGSKQLGQDIVEVKDGKAAINMDREIMSRLWYTYYEPMVTGRFTKLGKFCSDDIKTGDSLCFVGSTSSASYFPSELLMDDNRIVGIEMMALPMPVFENGDKVAASQGAGMVIVKSTKEKEYASALFLEWFTQEERNVSFSLNSSYLPVKKAALDANLLGKAFDAIDSGDTGAQNAIKALKVGIEQMENYNLYSIEVFQGGSEFRNRLPEALEEAVNEDRAAYLELLEKGTDPELAYMELHRKSEEKLDAWLDSFK